MNKADKDFLESCKVDFSAENVNINFEANLEALKGRISTTNNEESVNMTKVKFKKPLIAAIIAALVLSATGVVFAATQPWRQLETRVVEGEEHVQDFGVMVNEEESTTMMWVDMDTDTDERVVVEIEGEGELVLLDRLVLDNLDEALALFIPENPMTLSWLPPGFEFEEAVFPVNPIINPDEDLAMLLNVFYTDSEHQMRLSIAHFPQEWGTFAWTENLEEFSIDGYSGFIQSQRRLSLHVGDVLYTVDVPEEMKISNEDLQRMAQSLFE